jgi:hypothetical protein
MLGAIGIELGMDLFLIEIQKICAIEMVKIRTEK